MEPQLRMAENARHGADGLAQSLGHRHGPIGTLINQQQGKGAVIQPAGEILLP